MRLIIPFILISPLKQDTLFAQFFDIKNTFTLLKFDSIIKTFLLKILLNNLKLNCKIT